MIQAQILCKVLQTRDLSLITENNLTAEHFVAYKAQYEFIINHYAKYKNVPDLETFIVNFPTFQLFEVHESDEFLINTVSDEYRYRQTVPKLQMLDDLLLEDTNKAIQYLYQIVPDLIQYTKTNGIDIIQQYEIRLNKYKHMRDMGGANIILSGLKELDILMRGWLPGADVIAILARPNVGKTWILLKFLCEAWLQGKNVGLYSGEMEAEHIGWRIDSILGNFQNTLLMRGQLQNVEEYEAFLELKRQMKNVFFVITRKELDGSATVSKLNTIIERHNLEILGVDQLSLMVDERRQSRDDSRVQFGHITDDLMAASSKYKLPILLACQANREAEGNKDENKRPVAPYLHQIYDSDLVGQFASRVIGLCKINELLDFTPRKDRYDSTIGKTVSYQWDIDKGLFDHRQSNTIYTPSGITTNTPIFQNREAAF